MILPIDTIKNIINEAKEFSVNSVYFCGGDPFIFKDEMLELFKYCKENVPMVFAHTHATNLDEYCIDRLKEIDIHLNIPVYSYDEKVHDYIVNVKGNYKKFISVLKMLSGKGINFEAILYISEFNISNVERTANFFKNLGCKVVIQKFMPPQKNLWVVFGSGKSPSV
jgi:MoaA/NifB/PqqE/SkfB family radical SAM enzyme